MVPSHFVNFHFVDQFPLILVNVDKVGIDKLDEWELTKWDHISLQRGHCERTLLELTLRVHYTNVVVGNNTLHCRFRSSQPTHM